jgi:hypothetical protein
MNLALKTGMGLILAAAAGRFSAAGQSLDAPHPSALVLLSLPAPSPSAQPASGEVVREIDDPHNGDRWLLLNDPSRPGGPGRMVLAAVGPGRSGQPGTNAVTRSASRQKELKPP